MSVTPSIDYTCPTCGAKATYKLVPMMEEELRPMGESPALPSLDFTCARCGTRQTYMLSPATPTT
jgi:RNase P subunit RPR2